ncbi:MAG: flagellar basal body-associated FliL family protein [Spirochaetales bacterium]|nr:flagellar basal body-associated FliL family protein [Spirochaetales bacterium]
MGDEDIYTDDGGDGGALDAGQPSSPSAIKELLPKILKWVAIVVVAIIFIVTVVFFTMKVMNQGTTNQSYAVQSPEYETEPEVYSWYGLDEIRTRTADKNPATVIIKAKLGYEWENADIQTDLIQRSEIIYDAMRQFLSSKTAAELTPQTEMQIKQEMKEKINRLISAGKIQEIVFMEYNIFQY